MMNTKMADMRDAFNEASGSGTASAGTTNNLKGMSETVWTAIDNFKTGAGKTMKEANRAVEGAVRKQVRKVDMALQQYEQYVKENDNNFRSIVNSLNTEAEAE